MPDAALAGAGRRAADPVDVTATTHHSKINAAATRRRGDHPRPQPQRQDRAGEPISYRAVAQAAGVSRAWLYRQPDLRIEIDRLRTTSPTSSGLQLPAA